MYGTGCPRAMCKTRRSAWLSHFVSFSGPSPPRVYNRRVMPPEKGRGSSQKRANSLVALSSAAVLTVYAAGYLRTRPAAERIEADSVQRRTEAPTSVAGAPSLRTLFPGAASPGAVSPRTVSPAPVFRGAVSPGPESPGAAPTSTDDANAAPEPAPAESSTVPPSSASADIQIETPAIPGDQPPIAEPPAASIATQRGEYKD